jgi:hypothetical protein
MPGDADALTALFLASRRQAMPWLREVHSDDETRWWMGNVALRDLAMRVAALDGVVAGFAAIISISRQNTSVRVLVRDCSSRLNVSAARRCASGRSSAITRRAPSTAVTALSRRSSPTAPRTRSTSLTCA